MGSLPSKISGSRASAILGLNAFKTPVSVWMDIVEELEPGFCEANGYKREIFEGNAATELGNAAEGPIIEFLETESAEDGGKYLIFNQEKAFVHPDYDFLTCHIDGQITHRELFEGKTTNAITFSNKWGEPGTDKIPTEYQCQVQHNMAVARLPRAFVTVLVFPRRQDEIAQLENENIDWEQWVSTLADLGYFHEYRIQANPEVQKKIIAAEVDFWETYVIPRVPPEAVDYSDVRALFTAPKGTILADERIESLAREYQAIGKEISEANKRKTALKTEILKYMGSQAEKPIDDESVEKWILRDSTGKKLASYNGKTYR